MQAGIFTLVLASAKKNEKERRKEAVNESEHSFVGRDSYVGLQHYSMHISSYKRSGNE